MKEIPAITLWQPWASLLACGAKKYETRSWPIKYRGPIAIHAAAKKPSSIWGIIEGIIDEVRAALGIADPDDLPRGAIIAVGELVGCHRIVEPAKIEGMISTGKMITPEFPVSVYGNEYYFGDWTPGRYAWEFAKIKMLPEPIPAKGAQGLWKWQVPEGVEI